MLTESKCIWTQDEDGIWDTSCGGKFEVSFDTPRENGMNYCCYCGKSLTQKEFEESRS